VSHRPLAHIGPRPSPADPPPRPRPAVTCGSEGSLWHSMQIQGLMVLSQVARASEGNYRALETLGDPFFRGVYRALGAWAHLYGAGHAHGDVLRLTMSWWSCLLSASGRLQQPCGAIQDVQPRGQPRQAQPALLPPPQGPHTRRAGADMVGAGPRLLWLALQGLMLMARWCFVREEWTVGTAPSLGGWWSVAATRILPPAR
jgi:hypothetical protein